MTMNDKESLLFMRGQIKSLQKQIKEITAVSGRRKRELQECRYALKLLRKNTLLLESELNQTQKDNTHGYQKDSNSSDNN